MNLEEIEETTGSKLAGWSNLDSFLTTTTPVINGTIMFSDLWEAFKEPSAFGVLVPLRENNEDVSVAFVPTLSAVLTPTVKFNEIDPPYIRPSLWDRM
jgi:hypothetical protein